MEAMSGSGMFTAIVLSYNRPQNIPRVINGLLDARSIGKIVVSNNNPERAIDLPANARLQIISQQVKTPAAFRFFLAATRPEENFVCIDDDLFLTSDQIELLTRALIAEPLTPHGGPWGQKFVSSTTQLKGWCYPNDRVDVLNRAYVFTARHATRFIELCGMLNCHTPWEVGPWDDIVLSHCGRGRPITHDIGPWEACPTSNDPEIALWKQPDFHECRLEIFSRLQYANVR